MKNKKYPHDNVYARLGISKIHGVGVIAIRDIPKDTNIFKNDLTKISWVPKEEIDNSKIELELKRFYYDFCILKDNKYGVPENFNSITPGWYINEPRLGEESNVYPDKNYNFFARKNIKKGEELTVDYSSFSEHVKRY